jgi:hypothetical protein
MIDASFHVTNSAKEREFRIRKLNISLSDVLIDQQAGKDVASYNNFSLSLEEFIGDFIRSPGI